MEKRLITLFAICVGLMFIIPPILYLLAHNTDPSEWTCSTTRDFNWYGEPLIVRKCYSYGTLVQEHVQRI